MNLEGKLADRSAVVGIVGLGYVGVPLAMEFVRAGLHVVGFDVSAERVRRLNAGDDVILDVEKGSVGRAVKAGTFRATSDPAGMREPDVLVLCVPTPLTDNKDPDLAPLVSASEAVARSLRKGQLVSVESSTYPGTTAEVVRPILERGGLKVGVDVFLGYSPERVDPGNERFQVRNTPKVVSGVTPACLSAMQALYRTIVERVVPVSTTQAAEMAKLLENIFRNVNIALVNELMLMADRLEIDMWEVVEAAATKPFGFMPFFPGPGVGGHCIPVDPYYLAWKARQVDFHTNFINLAAEVNENMPRFVVEKALRVLARRLEKPIREATVMVLGVTFKRDVDDVRNSSAVTLLDLLRRAGLKALYHDPLIPEVRLGGETIRSVPWETTPADLAIVHTDHRSYDWTAVAARFPLILDCRNALHGVRGRAEVVRL